MATRNEKLKALKEKNTPKLVGEGIDGSHFLNAFQKKIDSLKEVLGVSVDVSADELVQELKRLDSLTPQVKELTEALDALELPAIPPIPDSIDLKGIEELSEILANSTELISKFNIPDSIEIKGLSDAVSIIKAQNEILRTVKVPDSVKLEGLPSLLKSIETYSRNIKNLEAKINRETKVNIELVRDENLKTITDKLDEISKAIGKNIHISNQDPGDYIPVRRVKWIGNKLVFDDDSWAGTNSGGSNGGGTFTGLTDDQLRATPVPVSVVGDVVITGDVIVDDVGVENASGVKINPATEEKQDSQIIESQTANTRIGSLTETAPASDTASSGLNGRLQRIAQRLTSLIGLLPGSLGQKARAASLAVTLSSEDITALTPPAAITGFATAANQTNGNQQVQGNISSGSTDSGNPIKIGGKYNATPPTFTDGQRGDTQLNSRGNLRVIFTNGNSDMAFGADNVDDVVVSTTANKAQFITRNTVFDGTGWDRMRQPTQPTDTQPISATTLPLPSGAATEATLATRLTESDFDTKIGSLTETAAATDTASSGLNGRLQRVAQRLTSIIALLPGSLGQKARAASLAVTLSSEDITALTPPAAITGFATAANQTNASQKTQIVDGSGNVIGSTGNAIDVNIKTGNITGYATETTLGTRLSESDFDSKIGSLTETAPASDTASSGLNGRLQRVAQRLTSLIGLFPTSIGQKNKAGSLSVTLASDQDTVPVSGTVTVTGVATAANQSTEQGLIGALTETAPASDTASSGLNGRLQRVAQRLTSLIALFPSSIGQKNKAGSLSVTLASDQDAVPISTITTIPQPTPPSTVRNNQVTVTTAGTRVALASSTAVNGVIVQALSTNIGNIYVGNATVAASNGFELQPGQATSVAVDDLAKVFVDAATNGDKACYIAS